MHREVRGGQMEANRAWRAEARGEEDGIDHDVSVHPGSRASVWTNRGLGGALSATGSAGEVEIKPSPSTPDVVLRGCLSELL